MSCDQTWVSTSVGSGFGNGSVIIAPQQNLTTVDRSATITVTSTLNSLTRTLVLSQPKFVFDVDTPSISFDSPIAEENSGVTVNVDCSDAWTVSKDVDWINLSATSGTGNSSFEITVQTNPNTADRTGKVTVTSTLNSLSKEIIITQKAFEFDSNPLTASFEACNNSSQEITVTCSGEWTLTNDSPSWLTATQSVSNGISLVVLTVSDNPSLGSRTATLTVKSVDNSSLVKTITVVQKGFTFNVSASTITLEANGTPISVIISCSSTWTISKDADWITVSRTSGTENGNLEIGAQSNSDTTPRNGTITITSTLNNLIKEISVTQAGSVI